jgi:catechol 2,3-dioxygenase-like lactoylglutathione lyase family enzyme
MKILFIASVSVITPDPRRSRALFVDTVGLPLRPHTADDEYHFSEEIGGSKHFGVWPLAQAAEACFGRAEWPADRAVPQCSIELEVESEQAVRAAAAELAEKGYTLLHETRKEPWGQTICRTQTPEGLLVGISHAPWLHQRA